MEYLHNMKVMNATMNELYAAQSVGEVVTFPETITLMPLQACNYKCMMCSEWQHDFQPEMDDAVLSKIEPVLPFVKTLFITGGEPLMLKRLERLLAMGRNAGCNLWMVSNGSLLTDSKQEMLLDYGLNRLKISLDAATQTTYKKIRGGNLFNVLKNIASFCNKQITRGRHSTGIQLGFVAMKSNIAELPKFVTIASQIGAQNVYVSYMGVQFEKMIPESLYFYQELSDKYMNLAAEVAKRHDIVMELPPLFSESENLAHKQFNRVDTRCHEPWRNVFIRPDGRVNLCCGGGGGCGNINEMSFEEIWNHPARVHARQRVNTPNPPKKCVSCKTIKQTPMDLGTHFNTPALEAKAKAWGEAAGLLKPTPEPKTAEPKMAEPKMAEPKMAEAL